MENWVFGILCVLVSLVVYYYSWRCFLQGNYSAALWLLIGGGLILRFYCGTDFFLHEWDERYHALVAKNLIKHPMVPTLYDQTIFPYNYKDWSYNHVWLHKQPLSLWTMALSMFLFGVNVIALRLPSILLSSISIFLSFMLGKYFFDKKVAFMAAFLFSINGFIIELAAGRTATDHVDIFYMFFIELAIYFSYKFVQKKQLYFNILVGLSLGAAVLTKWLPALIVLPIWLLFVLDSQKFKINELVLHFFSICIISGLVFIPWQIYIFDAFPNEALWESTMNKRHLVEVVEERSGTWLYYLERISIDYGDLIYLPLIWFIALVLRSGVDWKRYALGLWIFVPLVFFSFVKTKMPAYILFISPALFIVTAAFYYRVLAYRQNHRHKWFFTLLLFLLVALPIRYTIERMKPFKSTNRHPEWVVKLEKLQDEKLENAILLNYDRPIEAMYYADITAYSFIPSKDTLLHLMSDGYKLVINDKKSAPQAIREMDGILWVGL